MKKIKKLIKNNILGFVIGGLLFGTLGVYAATYFPSHDVTYDNQSSGMQATDVQGAIDELYNLCSTPPIKLPGLAGEILDKVPIVTSGDGLYKDEYEDRYIYKGVNPKNYITFNDEEWRIISLESDGTIKIMGEPNYRIGSDMIEWDTSGNNVWNSSTLKTFLNGEYYNALTTTAKNQITSHSYNVGAIDIATSSISESILNQINGEKATKWNGNVGLVTASEYIRANSNIRYCGSVKLLENNTRTCRATNWMYMNGFDYWWTITPSLGSSALGKQAIRVVAEPNDRDVSGRLQQVRVNLNGKYYPVVYLSSSLSLTGGTGTESDPYTIK